MVMHHGVAMPDDVVWVLLVDDDQAMLSGMQRVLRRAGFRAAVCNNGEVAIQLMRSVDLGRCLIGSIDDAAEVMAIAEGEDFR